MTEQEIIDSYAATASLRKTSAECHVSIQVARRILVTAGIYPSELTERINNLYNNGKSVAEIATYLGIQKNSVVNHLPYSRGSYTVGEKSENAIHISNWRKSK